MSATFRNETGNAGLDHRVEPASGLNSVNLLHGGVGNSSDIVVLANSLRSFRGGKDCRSALDRPGEQDLGGSQRGPLGNGQDCRIFQGTMSHSVAQWRKRQ